MPVSFGVNLRVTGHCSRGGRKYMEDFFSVAYQESENEKDLEYAFIGIYDGHGGAEAAKFARKHLINLIVNQKLFWSDNDDDILRAIREGYIATHYAMWREQDKWPKTATGLPSTAGTTASVAFIRHGKIYIGHAGDSGIVLGYTENEDDKYWRAMPLTKEHKPECIVENARIVKSGGKVVTKSGVPRVVWNRPRIGHQGPVRRSTPIDEIPFLAVARSLGDLWSYNFALNKFVVSPDPDVRVVKINPKKFRCLIFGTDGLWNVISANSAVEIARYAEEMNEQSAYNVDQDGRDWTNPSKCLVDKALEQWSTTRMRADNTSVVIIMIDPPGPPKRDVMKTCPQQLIVENNALDCNLDEPIARNFTMFDHSTKETVPLETTPMPTSGLAIMTRYQQHPYDEYRSSVKTTDYACASTSTNTDIGYMHNFADSYSSLLTTSNINTDHSYLSYQPATLGHSAAGFADEMPDDTYSLTRLETRTEQYRNSYDESTSTSTLFSDMHLHHLSSHVLQQQPPQQSSAECYAENKHQYDSISSSFLSQSCGIMQSELDDSVQANLLINADLASAASTSLHDRMITHKEDGGSSEDPSSDESSEKEECYDDDDETVEKTKEEEEEDGNTKKYNGYMDNSLSMVNDINEMCNMDEDDCTPSTSSSDTDFGSEINTDTTPGCIEPNNKKDVPAEDCPSDSGSSSSSFLDANIQIHEISSSSKETDDNKKTTTNSSPKLLRSAKKLDQQQHNEIRTTRSSKLLNCFKIREMNVKKNKNKNKIVQNIKKTLKAKAQNVQIKKSVVQNENNVIVTSRLSSRRTIIDSSSKLAADSAKQHFVNKNLKSDRIDCTSTHPDDNGHHSACGGTSNNSGQSKHKITKLELSQRTLRSKNLICSSSTSSKARVPSTTHHTASAAKSTTNNRATTTTTINKMSNQQVQNIIKNTNSIDRQLRDKVVKPEQQQPKTGAAAAAAGRTITSKRVVITTGKTNSSSGIWNTSKLTTIKSAITSSSTVTRNRLSKRLGR